MDSNSIARKKYNWWIPAFFIAFIAFEIARELLVLISDEPRQYVTGTITTKPEIDIERGYAKAFGIWSQADDLKYPVRATFAEIKCSRETMRCTESSAILNHGSIMKSVVFVYIDSTDYDIEVFTKDNVIYSSTNECYVYKVNINKSTETVNAIKERIPLNTSSFCSKTPDKQIFELKGNDIQPSSLDDTDSFIPIIRFIAVFLKIID